MWILPFWRLQWKASQPENQPTIFIGQTWTFLWTILLSEKTFPKEIRNSFCYTLYEIVDGANAGVQFHVFALVANFLNYLIRTNREKSL